MKTIYKHNKYKGNNDYVFISNNDYNLYTDKQKDGTIMRLRFKAKTNKDYCMINLARFRLVNGTEISIDRTITEFEIVDGILYMTWEDCYLWELCGYNIFDKEAYLNDEMCWILRGAKLVKLELEDDADEDYDVWDIEWWCA